MFEYKLKLFEIKLFEIKSFRTNKFSFSLIDSMKVSAQQLHRIVPLEFRPQAHNG